MSTQTTQEYRKLNNLCLRCGAEKEDKKNLCPKCAEDHKRRNDKYRYINQKELFEKRIKLGLCNYCGKEKESTKKNGCNKCLEAKRNAKRVQNEKRKSKGICISCSKTALPDNLLCPACWVDKTNKRKELKAYRRENKLCLICGIPITEFKYCRECLDKTKERRNKYIKKKKNQKES